MKKIFTLIAVALLGMGSVHAQTEGVVELSWDTMVKNEAGDNTADQNEIKFEGNGFVLKPTGGRAQAKTIREECGKVLNIKNNTNQVLQIPVGTKVYKINFYGWSQGDNWTYLGAYGPTTSEWEWEEKNVASNLNDDIIANAKYPLDPCVVSDAYHENEAYATQYPNGDRVYHNAGYCFASLDFSDEPYEGEFCFVFKGNNQERVWMVIYTTKEAAAAAEAAEPVTLGKDKSQTIFLDAAAAAKAEIAANTIELSWSTMVKNETGDNALDQNAIEFYADTTTQVKTEFILKPAGGRTQAQTIREYCGNVLNFKNNTNQTLVIPADKKIYKINFYGWSQGDNWTYLAAYGPNTTEWEWQQEAISNMNDEIIEKATYPIDPCVISEAYHENEAYATQYPNGDRVYHNAGYCFASIDFSNEPYEGEFCFKFGGNNQERAWMVVYTSATAAAAAPKAEAVLQGKENSVQKWIEAGKAAEEATGINTFSIQRSTFSNQRSTLYNLAGQKVGKDYKGIVIMDGKKVVLK